MPYQPSDFHPNPLLRHAHLQTVVATIYRRRQPDIRFDRTRLDTPDGDFIDIDRPLLPEYPLAEDAPLVLLLHGLEGDARQTYAWATYVELARLGIRSIGLNFRSCSGEMNRTGRLYHMGETSDLAMVHQWLESQYPGVPMAAVGYSLGGNVLLKYLGEHGAAMQGRFFAAVAISPPFSLTGRQAISEYPGLFYGRYLLGKLKRKARISAHLIAEHGGDPYRAITAGTLREFDDAVTAPLHGFRDSQDYYERCSSASFLPDIAIPTLIIRALDDPFFNQDIPYNAIASNQHLWLNTPRHGGHAGFMEGLWPWGYGNWAQREAGSFFRSILP